MDEHCGACGNLFFDPRDIRKCIACGRVMCEVCWAENDEKCPGPPEPMAPRPPKLVRVLLDDGL